MDGLARLGKDRTEFLLHDGGGSMQSAHPTDNLSEMQIQTIAYHIIVSGKLLVDSRLRSVLSPTGASRHAM